MDINSISEVLQSKIRLMIISSLLKFNSKKTYNELKGMIHTTDGNLYGHIKKLVEAGYLYANRGPYGKKHCTAYVLTELGRKDFQDYVVFLEVLLKNNDLTEVRSFNKTG